VTTRSARFGFKWLIGPVFAVIALTAANLIALYGALHHAQTLLAGVQDALFTLGVSVALASAVLAVYHYGWARRLTHLFLLFILLELFYRFAYHGPVSPGLLLSVPETSQRETLELLAGHTTLTWSLSLVALATLAAVAFSWRSPIRISFKKCLTAGAVAALMMIAASALGSFQSAGTDKPALRALFPFDLASAFTAVGRDWAETRRLASRRRDFRFPDATLGKDSAARGAKQVYVMVIGETSRRANWSLFGYARNTSPRLDAIKNDLIVFDHATSNATNTILSLPLTLTRASAADWNRARGEKSILALLREAGFETHWISNQERSDVISNPITQIADDAQFSSFTADLPLLERDAGLDSNLIGRIIETVKKAPQDAKLAIVVHMEGSHFGYKDRYPKSFERFTNGQGSPRPLNDWQQRLVDEYDNSILFTDTNLGAIIEGLGACECAAGLVYFSDHGERLFEGGPSDGEFGHGFPSVAREEIEVPLFFWLSNRLRASSPDLVSRLGANAHTPVQLHNVFESMVDLAGVTYTGRQQALSLFSTGLKTPAELDVLNLQQNVVRLPAR
jgi:glucan phosphoethanolaminetransferase (alkaline phosphatase superfamily)